MALLFDGGLMFVLMLIHVADQSQVTDPNAAAAAYAAAYNWPGWK